MTAPAYSRSGYVHLIKVCTKRFCFPFPARTAHYLACILIPGTSGPFQLRSYVRADMVLRAVSVYCLYSACVNLNQISVLP